MDTVVLSNFSGWVTVPIVSLSEVIETSPTLFAATVPILFCSLLRS